MNNLYLETSKLDQYNSLFEKLSPDDFYIIKQ